MLFGTGLALGVMPVPPPAAAQAQRAATAPTLPPRVEMELATEPRFPAVDAQPWAELLGRLGAASVRIRSLAPGDEPRIDPIGTPQRPAYRVTGILTSRRELIVPGGRFTVADRAAIEAWIARVAQRGAEAARPPGDTPYDLREAAWDQVRRQLAQPVDISTAQVPCGRAVTEVARRLDLALDVDSTAARALATADLPADELEGVACGTALAYLLAGAGLCFEPFEVSTDGRPQPEVAYRVVSAAAGRQPWSIGISADARRRQVLPVLVELIDVEIAGIMLDEALGAIAARLEVPLLVDHAALARRRIDLSRSPATLAPGRLTYNQILRKLLFPARLQHELRVDEAGQPFIWIEPLAGT